jgi:hypothetical protein
VCVCVCVCVCLYVCVCVGLQTCASAALQAIGDNPAVYSPASRPVLFLVDLTRNYIPLPTCSSAALQRGWPSAEELEGWGESTDISDQVCVLGSVLWRGQPKVGVGG